MRAAAPAGGTLALAHAGMEAQFDAIYATSAGAINASYFLSGQGDLGISIYFDDLTTGRFINPRRLNKIVDVDWVIDELVCLKKPLDVAKILASPTQFFVPLIDMENGEATMIDVKNSSVSVPSVIRAALALPVLYNLTVNIDGKDYMDGGLRIPFPIQQAIEDGCTDILLLLSRPEDFVAPVPPLWSKLIFELICARGRKGIRKAFSESHHSSRVSRNLALGRSAVPSNVNIATICTKENEAIHRTSVHRETLIAAATSYGKRTLRILGADPDGWALGPPEAIHWPGR
ncbi:patatin-like phospholipase family protein [Luteolibacter yonseiensis]|uniref:Patatin-like phospholipase family protein n=2 Tax=Luteolibacter yonseiensis TaxID=1144680 RepID=A0A934V9Y6_9BACT|nr:patatin-like phospholipase family protein [Luteolibacter yonseiensis]